MSTVKTRGAKGAREPREPKLGVLGGMGPQATQVFYQYVLDRTEASCDQEHLPALILSDTGVPDRTASILTGNTEPMYQRLLADARLLEECGVSLAMVTLGPRGCYLQNRRGSCALTAPQVSPVDTTGAGDIFGGSALHRLLDFRVPPEELDRGGLEEIARFAVTAASLSTQHPGGIPSIPSKEEVEAFLSRGV